MGCRILVFLCFVTLPIFLVAQHTVQYDPVGRMVSNDGEEIASVEWNNFDKIVRITRRSTSRLPDIEFRYDVLGNRVAKVVKPRNGTGVLPSSEWRYTYYTYDARQQQLGVYERSYEPTGNNKYKEYFSRQQQHIFLPDTSVFDKRIATEEIFNNTIAFTASAGLDPEGNIPSGPLQGSWLTDDGDKHPHRGDKSYVLKAEQQSVKEIVSDRKSAGAAAEVLMAGDYFPFGMDLADRQYRASESHSAFMSKEKMTEAYPTDAYDFGARMYSASLGRWLSPDAHAAGYPALSPYQAFGNSPMMLADPDGKDILYSHLVDQSPANYGLVKYLLDENDVFRNLTSPYKLKANMLRINVAYDNSDNVDIKAVGGVVNTTVIISTAIRRKEKEHVLEATYSELGRVAHLFQYAVFARKGVDQSDYGLTSEDRSLVERGVKEYVKEGKHQYTDQEIEAVVWYMFRSLPQFDNYLQQRADREKITKEEARQRYIQHVAHLMYDVETKKYADGKKETVVSPYYRGY